MISNDTLINTLKCFLKNLLHCLCSLNPHVIIKENPQLNHNTKKNNFQRNNYIVFASKIKFYLERLAWDILLQARTLAALMKTDLSIFQLKTQIINFRYRVFHETWQLVNSFKCLLPWFVKLFDIKENNKKCPMARHSPTVRFRGTPYMSL